MVIEDLVGQELVSEWRTIEQGRIDEFARATDDPQWIHTDPEASAAGPFGTTIAHGFLTLSLVVPMFAEALPALVLASLAVKLAPFRRVAAWARGRDRKASVAMDQAALRKARWAVEAWARRVPWRAVCFQRGLAAHAMLQRRGVASTLHYGVAQPRQAGLKAHVWVTAGHLDVLGVRESAGYARLASFPPAP